MSGEEVPEPEVGDTRAPVEHDLPEEEILPVRRQAVRRFIRLLMDEFYPGATPRPTVSICEAGLRMGLTDDGETSNEVELSFELNGEGKSGMDHFVRARRFINGLTRRCSSWGPSSARNSLKGWTISMTLPVEDFRRGRPKSREADDLDDSIMLSSAELTPMTPIAARKPVSGGGGLLERLTSLLKRRGSS